MGHLTICKHSYLFLIFFANSYFFPIFQDLIFLFSYFVDAMSGWTPCRASTSYFFPIFSYFSKIFLFIPIFAPKFLFFPIFSLIWKKTYRYLQVCSYMTISATVENFNSVQIMAHLDIGLTHLKHREDICTHLYLDL